MRDYYYLPGLSESPFDVSIEDALHLGATSSLGLYALITDPVRLECRKTGDVVQESGIFVHVQWDTLAQMEKEYVQGCNSGVGSRNAVLAWNYDLPKGSLDDRCYGPIPMGLPFFDDDSPVPVELTLLAFLDLPPGAAGVPNPSVRITELVCFSEDLERLASRGFIKYRTDASKDSVSESASPTETETETEKLHPRKETSHLQIIAALMSNDDIEVNQPHKGAQQIQAIADSVGAQVPGEDTLVKIIRKAANYQ